MLKISLCVRTAIRCSSTAISSQVNAKLPNLPLFKNAGDNTIVSIINNTRSIPYLPTNIHRICISPHIVSVDNVPLPLHRREIVDPLAHLRISKEIPSRPIGTGEISLPELIEKEILEPTNNVIEKQAARLIVIRRAKMKKHKWRKLQKKMKFTFARRRQKRELKKEKAFQAVLVARVKEAEKFDAEAFVARQLEIAHWERPITHVRNRRAPDWVIREHIQEIEEKRRIDERIEQCLQFKKS